MRLVFVSPDAILEPRDFLSFLYERESGWVSMEQWSLKKVKMRLAGNGGHYRGEDGVSRERWAL